MTYFYHIADPVALLEAKKSGCYHHPSLEKEGFIHGSIAEQLEGTANLYYASVGEIIILKIAQELVEPIVIYEEASRGGLYPHIFGPLNLNSVVRNLVLAKSVDGLFRFHEDLMKE